MIVLSHQASPPVAHAVDRALQEAERLHEVAFLHKREDTLMTLHRAFSSAALVAFDLSTTDPSVVLSAATRGLEHSPFVQVVVSHAPLGSSKAQRYLFEYGRIGVNYLPSQEESISAAWWVEVLSGITGFNILHRAKQAVLPAVPSGERGELVLRIADCATAPTVKDLVKKLYVKEYVSPSTRRKRLWAECKAADLDSPEAVLYTVRLVMIKHLLDTGKWTLTRIARHFGYTTARQLSRSCKTRTGLSLKQLRAMPMVCVVEYAQRVLTGGQPLAVLRGLGPLIRYYL